MTGFEIERLPFTDRVVARMRDLDPRFVNWPVVYVLDDGKRVYVGETLNAAKRMEQHRAKKGDLKVLRLVMDDRFNKSACLDLESTLIRLFSGDEKYTVINANAGLVDYEYFDRASYQRTFDRIFDELRSEGMFTRSITEIENSDLFKLSPFKALNDDQAAAVDDILDGLFADMAAGRKSLSVVQGEPGTGKTIVAIYLLKLLSDIVHADPEDLYEGDVRFSEFFVEAKRALLAGRRVGFVVPQQSLRTSIKRVFRRTPGMHPSMVLTPFEVGASSERWDLLIVDEAHRLTQRANQASGPLNKKFREINQHLFGDDRLGLTQLDWIRAQSDHQIFLLDSAQSVRPADLPQATQAGLLAEAGDRRYQLRSQMRVRAGSDYVDFVRRLLSDAPPARQDFGDYDLRLFDDVGAMRAAIRAKDQEEGLARMVAGYAWEWQSKKDPTAYDIELDGQRMRWNSTATDWINAAGSIDEIGSIHTVQGYDLNYAGVIIGPDLRLDLSTGRVVFDRANYKDRKGQENNPTLGVTYSDEDLLEFVRNIYRVLLTRGMRGTYVYVCDPALRERVRKSLA
jgi:DUF2075 family protein/predicted GIY-YIG superfamily endonuclease